MYKVIKTWPNGPIVGTIFARAFADGAYETPNYVWHIPTHNIENNPEFFAPRLFITEDGVDVYRGDTFYVLNISSKYWHPATADTGHKVDDQNWKYFSTEVAVETYAKTLKQAFKKNQWIIYKTQSDTWLFKFKEYRKDGHLTCKESYHFWVGKLSELRNGWFFNDEFVEVATEKQIQEMLTKVARSKGFVPGVTFKSATTAFKWKCTGKFAYTIEDEFKDPEDCLYQVGGGVIYENGVWAEIVEAVEEKPFVKGEWLYMSFVSGEDTCEFIGRYSHTTNKHHVFSEEYGLENGKITPFTLTCLNNSQFTWHTDHVTTKATPQKIEEILTKVAIYKGFTKGVKVKKKHANGDLTCTGEYYYSSDSDSLFGAAYLEGGPFIYRKGEWAEFKKEVKKDPIKVILSDKEIVEVKETTAMIDYAKDGEIVGFQINV